MESFQKIFVTCGMYAQRHYEQEPHPLQIELGEAISWCDKIFAAIKPEAFYQQPIAFRHPIIFYYGHLPAFAWNQLLRGVQRIKSFNAEFDQLFERGIDPPENALVTGLGAKWPTLPQLSRYKSRVEDELSKLDFSDPAFRQVLHISIEHYWMHAETLLYIVHQLPHELKNPIPYDRKTSSVVRDYGALAAVPEGYATLGANAGEVEFVWCNELREHRIFVPSFGIDKYNVTNGAFLEFVEAGGYERQQLWDADSWEWIKSTGRKHPQFWVKQGRNWVLRELFEDLLLPLDWPVYVSHAEAAAYARSKGAELPSEEEWHRASVGARFGNYGFRSLSPAPVGAVARESSKYGVCDLIGNGWEWTRTIFAPFAGFKPIASYAAYSADFFDGRHYVMKGASPVTADKLVRPSFRNWFRPHYPYVYATFRCIYR